ncbi:hypothetical protein BBJ28_00016434 [Nothophytophthora sp. Chile5]|nr:hypothetical protein BBJ28_00016434 [Nothophytophthora sp. Chile5]
MAPRRGNPSAERCNTATTTCFRSQSLSSRLGGLGGCIAQMNREDLGEEGQHLRYFPLSKLAKRVRSHPFVHVDSKSNRVPELDTRFERQNCAASDATIGRLQGGQEEGGLGAINRRGPATAAKQPTPKTPSKTKISGHIFMANEAANDAANPFTNVSEAVFTRMIMALPQLVGWSKLHTHSAVAFLGQCYNWCRDGIEPMRRLPLVEVSLTYTFSITHSLDWTVRKTNQLQTQIVSVECI